MSADPAISVVVPTRDRPDALARCLAALGRQTARSLEVVVVDDGSQDAGAVRAVAGDGARVVRSGGAGPAAARNRGVREARGAVVCFTDDDCAPDPRWAELLAGACGVRGAAAGATIADPAAGLCPVAAQLLTHVLQVSSLDRETGVLGFAPTCNLACSAHVARSLPFDESFPLAAGEDRDWCARLAAAGVALRFVPAARVVHRPQLGVRALVRQQRRYGRGAVRFRGAGSDRRLAGAAFYRLLAREAAAAGAGVSGLVLLAQAAVAAGAVEEWARASTTEH